jgi:hypothetical protein
MQLLRVERLDHQHSWGLPKPLWLAWLGEKMPPLSELGQLYLRRFGVDHWYRESQATSSLDSTQTQYSQTVRTVERFDATDELGVVVGA